MRTLIPFLLVFALAALLLGVAAPLRAESQQVFDWSQWRDLSVLDGGRFKPLDTLARETYRSIANQGHFRDPANNQKLDALTLYLVSLLEWQGWEAFPNPHGTSAQQGSGRYFRRHRPDRWDELALLRIGSPDLAIALGGQSDQKAISPVMLSQAKFKLPGLEEERPFVHWTEGLLAKQDQGLNAFETRALELADRFWMYQAHRMGDRLNLLPIQGSAEQQWITLADLMMASFDDATDPSGKMRQAQNQFRAVREAYLAGSAAEFNRASADFLASIRSLGPALGSYPSPGKTQLEVWYNQWLPFRFGWVLTLIALVSMLLKLGTGWKLFYRVAWIAFISGLLAMSCGFILRTILAGRAPIANMYESVIFVGFGVALLGAIFESIHRRGYVLMAAAAVTTLVLVLADNAPVVLDASFQPLQPVLRSNFWLVTHVMTITLSYAALALALGIGNITLGYFLAGSQNTTTIQALTDFTYRAIQVGVLLLAAGTILGGVWADYSWGRFWGWDPKEVWALVALLGYLAVLHARIAGWVRQFGLAALSVICFSLVVMAWYGVNFVLGAGLHSYGFGGGGRVYVLAGLLLQGVYVAAAALRFAVREASPNATA